MVKRKRKPMSEEQRAAAAERLRKAREARGHDGSASVHSDLLNMDEDHPLHWKKVREWIKDISEELRSKKNLRLSKESKERQEYHTLENYLGNLKKYLESSVWLDNRYGRHREGKIKTFVRSMAYYPNGRPKRTLGFFYADIGEYTMEMKQHEDRVYGAGQEQSRTRKQFHEQKEVLDTSGEDREEFWDDILR